MINRIEGTATSGRVTPSHPLQQVVEALGRARLPPSRGTSECWLRWKPWANAQRLMLQNHSRRPSC